MKSSSGSIFWLVALISLMYSCASKNLREPIRNSRCLHAPFSTHHQPLTLAEKQAFDPNNRLSFTDEKGLKQGLWEERGWRNSLNYRINSVDDIPHGAYIIKDNYFKVGTYNQGKKNGIERWTYTLDIPDNDLVVLFFENDTLRWQAHPAADSGQLIPVKGIRVFADSVFVEIPFYNGIIWYKGLYMHNKPEGTHQIYYPNGKLQGWVNYEIFQSEAYDSLGHVLSQDPVWWGGNNYLIVPKDFRKK